MGKKCNGPNLNAEKWVEFSQTDRFMVGQSSDMAMTSNMQIISR